MTDKERWLHDRMQAIRARRERLAEVSDDPTLTPQERLVASLWLMARSMGDAGDLAIARARDPTYLRDALVLATRLDLPLAVAAFSLSEGGLERRFFDLFDGLCNELRCL